MFADAIETVGGFTRPVFTISRAYGSKEVIPTAGTLFFVNDRACALTSKTMALMLKNADAINRRYADFQKERENLRAMGRTAPQDLAELEYKYQYTPDTVVQMRSSFVDCVDRFTGFRAQMHPKFDLALIEFIGYQKILYQGAATFKKDSRGLRQGDYLCRLGFAFPEFNNYRYVEETDSLEWTKEGNRHSPRFPMDGMITRFLADKNGLNGIELSTPGLQGQSGGPLFDRNGSICGMQTATRHLHTGFDLVDADVLVNGKHQKVTDHAFLHLGMAVHVDVIKAFLREHQIEFHEEAGYGFSVSTGKRNMPLS